MTWHDQVPKIELHVHLEGAIPHAALFALMQKYGGDPAVPDEAALVRRFEYKDFPQFIAAWSWKNRFLREYEDFAYLAELTARDMAAQGIRYAEVFFSPSLFARRGLAVQELTRAVRAGLAKVAEIEIALVADLVRDFGPESELTVLAQLGEVRELGVIGIGIGGSEHEFPPALFKRVFEQARALGFRTNAHAGEALGAQSIWDAVRELGVERIGHGTRAWEDPELVRHLVERQLALEMCPMSNVRTQVVRSLREHPIRQYFQAGMLVTVNSDDPKMFQTSLADEYRLLEQECGFSRADIRQFILNAIHASWLPPERKTTLAEEFQRSPAWSPEKT